MLKSDIKYRLDIRWNEETEKFCIGQEEAEKQFDVGQMKSLDRVGRMVESNGGKYFKSLEEVASYLNKGGAFNEEINNWKEEKRSK